MLGCAATLILRVKRFDACLLYPLSIHCPLRSACRAVWYCGTTCSHADWREGGHRRVCKALGEARQAAKEARRAGAAAAGAAEGQQ